MYNLLFILLLPTIQFLDCDWKTTSLKENSIFAVAEEKVYKIHINDYTQEGLKDLYEVYKENGGHLVVKCIFPAPRDKKGFFRTQSLLTVLYLPHDDLQ